MTKNNLNALGAKVLVLDQHVHDLARPYADHLLMRLLSRIGKTGDQPPMLTLSAMVLATGIASERPRMMFAGTRMIAAHLLATGAKHLIKRRIDRERPGQVSADEAPRPRPGEQDTKETTSFPSGHTAGAFAVARAFGRAYPEHAGKALGAAGMVAAAQVGAGKHYLTDVLTGVVIGLAAEAAVLKLAPVSR